MKSRYDNEMELQFISKSRNEAFARITVAAFAAQLDPTIEELADIKTAVSEAVTNCIVHAYEDTEGIIKLRATLLDNVLEIEISDNGKGIEDVELARKPLYTTKGNLERSGMGFTIMESFMDEIEIHSVVGIGTKVVMKKRIKKEDNEIIEEESLLISAKIKIVTLTNTTPHQGTPCLFVFAKILGIIFIFAIPWQILARPFTVEFCVLTTASAATKVIQILPALPRRFSP